MLGLKWREKNEKMFRNCGNGSHPVELIQLWSFRRYLGLLAGNLAAAHSLHLATDSVLCKTLSVDIHSAERRPRCFERDSTVEDFQIFLNSLAHQLNFASNRLSVEALAAAALPEEKKQAVFHVKKSVREMFSSRGIYALLQSSLTAYAH